MAGTAPDAIAGRPQARSDAALVERARAGDHEAFAELLDAHLQPTFRTAMAILGNEAEARDATQAVFVLCWTRLPQLRDADLFPAWFGRIVVNTARQALRGRRRRTVREIHTSALPTEADGLAERAVAHEDRTADLDRLERAFERLTPDERSILWLHHYEELTLDQIADRIGIRATTVKSRLFTARRALEHSLEVEDR